MVKEQTRSADVKEDRTPSYVGLGLVVVVLLAIGAFLLVTTAPLEALLGESAWGAIGAFHGLAAGLLMIVATIGLYLAYRLFIGQIKAFHDLQLLSVVVATLSFNYNLVRQLDLHRLSRPQ